MADIVNQEALDSNIYNPPADQTSLTLYQMMLDSSDPTTESTLLQPYIDSFNALPTANQFPGVVVNPASCEIDDINNGLQDIQTQGGIMIQSFPVVADDWNAYLPDLQADTTAIQQQLAQVQDHTDRLSSNLPSLTGIAQASMALATLTSLLSNPCLGLGNFFGSLMDQGKQLFNSITGQINQAVSAIKEKVTEWTSAITGAVGDALSAIQSQIKSAVTSLISNIKDMMTVAKDAVSQFVNQITSEITNFAKAMLAQVRQGLADLLSNLPKDPCLKNLLGSVVTGAAAAIL